MNELDIYLHQLADKAAVDYPVVSDAVCFIKQQIKKDKAFERHLDAMIYKIAEAAIYDARGRNRRRLKYTSIASNKSRRGADVQRTFCDSIKVGFLQMWPFHNTTLAKATKACLLEEIELVKAEENGFRKNRLFYQQIARKLPKGSSVVGKFVSNAAAQKIWDRVNSNKLPTKTSDEKQEKASA